MALHGAHRVLSQKLHTLPIRPVWSPDGLAMLYLHRPRGIVAHDLTAGQDKVVVDRKANAFTGFSGFAVSPDGASLAFGGVTGQGPSLDRVIFLQTAVGLRANCSA